MFYSEHRKLGRIMFWHIVGLFGPNEDFVVIVRDLYLKLSPSYQFIIVLLHNLAGVSYRLHHQGRG